MMIFRASTAPGLQALDAPLPRDVHIHTSGARPMQFGIGARPPSAASPRLPCLPHAPDRQEMASEDELQSHGGV